MIQKRTYQIGVACLVAFLTTMAITDNNDFPKNYFDLPVNRAIKLSGTFGELRSNHFHSGIDIKSANGSVGEPVLASAAGHIARINVQAFSYGRALYIDHPNGYTTVYAHLNSFSPEIEAYVKKKQYQAESFSVNLYPGPSDFKFEKGQEIGTLGNSGYSFGPHLHFEIRRTADQVPMNPILFGLDLQDNTRPYMQELVVYHLNEQLEVVDKDFYPVQQSSTGKYTLGKSIEIPAWRVAFGLKTFDRMDGVGNRNGIYGLDLFVDEEMEYGFAMDAIPFNKTRYLNAHLDYGLKKQNRGAINRCFKLPGNYLDIYQLNGSNGITKLYQEKPRNVRIAVKDSKNNISELNFDITRATEMKEPESRSFHFKIPHNQPFSIDQNGVSINFPSNTFYDPNYLQLVREESEAPFLAPIYQVGDEGTPVHRYYSIAIEPTIEIKEHRNKTFIAQIDSDGKILNSGGEWKGNKLQAQVRSLGKFTVMQDTEPPVITPISFAANMTGWKNMSFRITDNFNTTGRAKGLKFRASLNGKWILMEYDGKRDLLIHRFDDQAKAGKNELQLIVTDDRGNKKTLKREFTR